MANILFVNLQKSADKIKLASKEASFFGHNVYHVLDKPTEKIKDIISKKIIYVNSTDFLNTCLLTIDSFNIDYVTTQTDLFGSLLDVLSKEYNVKIIPNINKFGIIDFVDKIKFSETLKKCDLPHIKYWVPKNVTELMSIKGPIFVKPSNGTAGSVKGQNHGNRYAFFDYQKFDDVTSFYKLLIENNKLNNFFDTQNNGSEFVGDKGVKGILGKHIIQECVEFQKFIIVNVLIIKKTIYFVVASLCNPAEKKEFYYQDNNFREDIFINQHENHDRIIAFYGEPIYKEIMRQLVRISAISEIDMSYMSVDFLNHKGQLIMQDANLRIGGTPSKKIINLNLIGKIPSLYNYII